MITINNVSKSYGKKEVLRNLNLTIEKGSFTAILGPNGAGKSTLISILLGMKSADSGEIHFEADAKVGVVFQNSCLDQFLTVRENLMVRAGRQQNAKVRVEVLLEELEMTQLAKQLYGTLSGGQRRRVDIARALLDEPNVLFLDEPMTGLDTQTRQTIWTWLQNLQAQQDLTLILTTHYLNEADEADKIYVLDHGNVLAKGTPQELKSMYANNQFWIGSDEAEVVESLLAEKGYFTERQGEGMAVSVDAVEQVLEILALVQPYLRDFHYQPGTLDDVFVRLTGRKMRDDA